jgi:hypothetical protein
MLKIFQQKIKQKSDVPQKLYKNLSPNEKISEAISIVYNSDIL